MDEEQRKKVEKDIESDAKRLKAQMQKKIDDKNDEDTILKHFLQIYPPGDELVDKKMKM